MPKHTFVHGPFEYEVQPMKARTLEEARAELQQLIHDCPDCQAARGRGEVPQIVEVSRVPMRERFRKPRWRTFKRRVRR